jgi:hypothetical protein
VVVPACLADARRDADRDGRGSHRRDRSAAAGGGRGRSGARPLHRDQAVDIAEDGIAISDDIGLLEQLVEDLGARLVVIDPVVAHLPMKIDSRKDQGVRRALGPLSKLAERQDCAVLGIVHLNKTQGLAPLARVGGSGAFGNAARSVLLLDRDPDDPDGEMGARRVLAHIKCNVGPTAGSLLYRVEPLLLPAVDGQPEVSTSRLELLGESSHSGSALLAGVVSEEERSEFEEACEFLRAELGDGQRHLAVELYREAGELGMSDRKLRRARKKIGAKTEKTGFGRGWEWWIPQGEDGAGDAS